MTKHTADTLKVFPVDLHKLGLDLSTKIQLEVRGAMAIIMEPRLAVIGPECVGVKLETLKSDITLYVYRSDTREQTQSKVTGKVRAVKKVYSQPLHGLITNVEKLLNYTSAGITLREYMGNNYQMNSRLLNNEIAILNYINGGK